jgi:hypothetical protein
MSEYDNYVFNRPDRRRVSYPVRRECDNCGMDFEPYGRKKFLCHICAEYLKMGR